MMRLLLTIDELPDVAVPIELPDDHPIARRALLYADVRAVDAGGHAEHLRSAIEDEISADVRVTVEAP